MALGSASSPNGSQPRLSSASRSRRRQRSNQQNIEDSKGGIKFLAWAATIAAAVTFVMGFTCTKLYITSAPGFVKKATFMVFLLFNSISMLTSVVALTHLIWAQLQSDFQMIQKAMLRAMALVTVAFVTVLVAFMVGVFLVLIRLPWQTYFIKSSLF